MASIQIASVFTAIGFKVNKKDLDNLQKQLRNLKKQISGLTKSAKIGFKIDSAQITSARSKVRGLVNDLEQVKSKTVRINVQRTGGGGGGRGAAFAGGAVGSQVGQFGPGVGLTGAVAFGGLSILRAGQGFEAVTAGLIAASGGIAKGADSLNFMVDLSERLGINFEDNVRSFQNFQAAAKSLDFSTQKTRDVFEATASAARVLGLSAADTSGVMRAMTQILSKGTVQSEELRGQLGERLPGAVGLMAKAIGVSVQRLNEMLQNGEVISKDVLPKMADAMITFAKANGALDKAVNSNLANQERLNNAWFFFKVRIAQSGFMDVMTEAFVTFARLLKDNTDSAIAFSKVFSGIARIVKAIVFVFAKLIKLFAKFPTILKILIGLIALLLLPFGPLIGAIVLIVAVMEELFLLLSGEGGIIRKLTEDWGDFAKVLGRTAAALALVVAGFVALKGLRKFTRFGGLTESLVGKGAKGAKAVRVAGSTLGKTGVGAALGAGGKRSGLSKAARTARNTLAGAAAIGAAGAAGVGSGAAIGTGLGIAIGTAIDKKLQETVGGRDFRQAFADLTRPLAAFLGSEAAQKAIAETKKFEAESREKFKKLAKVEEAQKVLDVRKKFEAESRDLFKNGSQAAKDLVIKKPVSPSLSALGRSSKRGSIIDENVVEAGDELLVNTGETDGREPVQVNVHVTADQGFTAAVVQG